MFFYLCFISLLRNFSLAYENLALYKPAQQDHPYFSNQWGADKAVDGKYDSLTSNAGQCVISANGQTTATWWVNLEGVYSISHINIIYRTDNLPHPSPYVPRLAGFFLYVSNTSSREGSHLCFHEIQKVNGTPSENQTTKCPVHGQYVIFYNERKSGVKYPSYYSNYAFNELCELQVFGCERAGFYGENCNLPCSNTCQNSLCHIHTGECYGCVPGYQGPRCEQICSTGSYGSRCSSSCGNCRKGETCHHVNGTCLNGCEEGFQGTTCEQACQAGYYGENCGRRCSENCVPDNECNRFNGECSCKPGWNPPNCNHECDGRTFGVNCTERCGHCFGNRQCHHVNGTCIAGCSSGYQGSSCVDKCEETFWGVNCKENCSTDCVNQTCYHDTGECYTSKAEDNIIYTALAIAGGILAAVFSIAITIAVYIWVPRFSDRSKQNMNLNSNQSLNAETIKKNTIDQNVEKEHVNGTLSSRTKPDRESKHDDTDDDTDDEGRMHDDNPYEDMYYNVDTLPDISVEKLEEIILEKRKEDNDGFKREYAALPYGKKYTCDAGSLPGNVAKNRYQTSLPYDHTRVKLKNGESDYINANYINGLEEENAYIAAEGPKQNTMSDFWAMVWQERVTQIVMLTNLKEGNKAKCHQYWPDVGVTITVGGFSLHTVDEKHYAFYVIRTVRLIHKKLKEMTVVQQYHFTAWLDHGIPDPFCLVVFHNHVERAKSSKARGPTLVHCSAGIGRSGTYISIDALYKAGLKDRTINIAEFVKRIRENRMNMVQTYEQYMTIYLVLEHAFKAAPEVMKKTEFLGKNDEMKKNKPENHSQLRKEFQNLLKVRPSYTEDDYKLSRQFNRGDVRILPLDKYSLFLPSSVRRRGNYINAISLPSYTQRHKFIVTHYPPLDDTVDLVRLLIDHESDTVISMNPLSGVKSSEAWLPDSAGSKCIGPFTVQYQQGNLTNLIKCFTIHILTKEQEKYHAVEVVEPTCSFQSNEGQCVKQLLEMVSIILGNGKEGPVTVMSSDGAAMCGVLCAVYNVLQQLSIDEEIDIFSTVRQLQIRRPELCSTWTEYKMIHAAVMEYIETHEEETEDTIYSNQ